MRYIFETKANEIFVDNFLLIAALKPLIYKLLQFLPLFEPKA